MLLFAAAALIATAPAADAPKSPDKCPGRTQYYAYRGTEPLKPRKLTELPPAIGYMAVYRHIGKCEVPMTVTEYRSPRAR